MASQRPWVQVLGRIAVHLTQEDPSRLTGSGQRLLSVLIAAGPEGTSAERIADAIWAETQPNPWRPALRMSVARLRKQLPEEWGVVSEARGYRITPGDGWIDAWRLEELSSGSDLIAESDLSWVLAGEPYADVDVVEIVGANTEHLRLLQIAIAERFCFQAPSSISTATCSALCALLREHPYNERLAAVVAECLANAGRRPEALAAVASFLEIFEAEFDWAPEQLTAFLGSGGSASATDLPPRPIDQPQQLTREPALPKELRHLGDTPILGREKELAALIRSSASLLTGASGSGKSRLLAALISSDWLNETTYVAGDDTLQLLLGPFAAAIPQIRDELVGTEFDESKGARDDGSGERAASTRGWRIVLDHFERRGLVRPQHLVVDDAHLLDSASLGLLRLLIRSNSSSELAVTVCGRSDVEESDWVDFLRDAHRAGLEPVELIGLDLATIEDLVYGHFPGATREARRGLALDILEASGGLPAVAVPLIAAADPSTLALPEQLPGASALGSVAASLSVAAREVAASAAVLGRRFSIGALISLVGLDEDEVFDCLDEMWAGGLIDETNDPDQVQFRHLLIQSAFIDAVPMYRRSQLHRLAAELTQDPHERAWHQASAGSLISPQVAADSLLQSARLLAQNRQWRRVARQLRRAEALVGDQLDVSALILWAAALDQSGADGVGPRRAAYRGAVATQNWEAALGAAIAGLPEAERPDGDLERIEMLEGIPATELPTELRFDLVLQLARQHALAGNRETALNNADTSIELASDPDEIGLSHVCRWTALRHLKPRPPKFPAELFDQGNLAVRTRVAQMSSIGAAEAGDFAEAREHADRFDGLATELGDPLRQWQSMVLRAMFLFDDGSVDAARRSADEAVEFAQLFGLQQGTTTWAGQVFHHYYLQGRAAELWPTLESYRPNIVRSSMASSAMVLCQAAAGVGEPQAEVRKLVLGALDRPKSHSIVVLGILAPLIRSYTPDLAGSVREVLQPFAESSIVVGFGIANLGPMVRYISQLVDDRDEEAALLRQAVAVADRHGPILSRVLNRLDLGDIVGGDHAERAVILAAGTELAPIVANRLS